MNHTPGEKVRRDTPAPPQSRSSQQLTLAIAGAAGISRAAARVLAVLDDSHGTAASHRKAAIAAAVPVTAGLAHHAACAGQALASGDISTAVSLLTAISSQAWSARSLLVLALGEQRSSRPRMGRGWFCSRDVTALPQPPQEPSPEARAACGQTGRDPAPPPGTSPLPGLPDLYETSWAERDLQAGTGAGGTWVPAPFEKAKTILVSELRRNMSRWAGYGGTGPGLYATALAELEAATGPVTLTLPGHVLAITPSRDTTAGTRGGGTGD